MKTLKSLFLLCSSLAVILAVIVGLAIHLRESRLSSGMPLTMRDLDDVGKRLSSEAVRELPPPDDGALAAGDTSVERIANVPLTRLERCLSTEELGTRKTIRSSQERDARIKAGICLALESVSSFVSQNEAAGWAWERGDELYSLGNWSGARRCYQTALESPLSPGQLRHACARLAWLEDDPERAARFLELACQGDAYGANIPQAIDLCRATGSDTLERYYLNRLRALNPQMAGEYEDEKKTGGREKTQ